MRVVCLLLAALVAAPAGARAADSGNTFLDCPDCPAMAVLPGGSFDMGSTADEAASEGIPDRDAAWERPRHRVTLAPFAVSVHEVTEAQWAACAADGACKGRHIATGIADGPHPVVEVDWDGAAGYAAWLAARTGRPYRLPTEAEWEYAARAGTATARYWGNGRDQACAFENVHDESSEARAFHNVRGRHHKCDDQEIFSGPVGGYAPNPFGLYDMLGNVEEWVADCWHPSYDGAPADGSARGRDGCFKRVVRGGSWMSLPRFARAARRLGLPAIANMRTVGFRVALPLGE